MARTFTTAQLALLQSPVIKARILTQWVLDDATHYFCDDVEDLVDTTSSITYIGASALAACTDINSANGYAAEPVTLTVDGTRLQETGFVDPATLFRGILALNLKQRRVNILVGLMYPEDTDITLSIPVYAGKINSTKVVYPKITFDPTGLNQTNPGKMEIQLDSLAARYGWQTGRTRSDQDQRDIDPTDGFFKFVQFNSHQTDIYWGVATPNVKLAWDSVYGTNHATELPTNR